MGLGNYFLDMSLKTQGRKNINKQVRLHQAKNLCTGRQIKSQPIKWEKYLQTMYLIRG